VIHHSLSINDHEARLLKAAIGVARDALARFERPRRISSRWAVETALPHNGLIGKLHGCRARYLGVRWSSDASRTMVRIYGRDTELKAPLVEIEETRRRDARPLAAEADEIDALMVRWRSSVERAVSGDEERNARAARLLAAMAIREGSPPDIVSGAVLRLPSVYQEGYHQLSPDSDRSCDDSSLLKGLDAIFAEPARSDVMEEMPTASITSQWWNDMQRGRQRRVRFDLSGWRVALLPKLDTIETLRLLSE
jgi:hypothetical protein